MSSSNHIKIPAQSRDLNVEPDPQEPSFSYEEKLVDKSPFLSIRDEDELYRLTARTNQRIRNGSSNNCGNPESNSSDMKPVLRNSILNFSDDVAGLRSSSNVVSVKDVIYYVDACPKKWRNVTYAFLFPVIFISFLLGCIEVLLVCPLIAQIQLGKNVKGKRRSA